LSWNGFNCVNNEGEATEMVSLFLLLAIKSVNKYDPILLRFGCQRSMNQWLNQSGLVGGMCIVSLLERKICGINMLD
jgi:hypothetical protein